MWQERYTIEKHMDRPVDGYPTINNIIHSTGKWKYNQIYSCNKQLHSSVVRYFNVFVFIFVHVREHFFCVVSKIIWLSNQLADFSKSMRGM